MIKKLLVLAFILSAFILISCKKTPGFGGNARIRGKVYVKQYDPFFVYQESEYFGPNIAVQITFGDDISPDATENTNANGEFEFQYMRTGKYTVNVYSKVLKDSLHPSGLVPVDTTFTINNSHDIVDLGTLTIQK